MPLAFNTLKLNFKQTKNGQNANSSFSLQKYNKAIVIASIRGVSPIKLEVNYTLLSENQISPFKILPLTGSCIFLN